MAAINAVQTSLTLSQTHYLCENYIQADLQRLAKLQLAHWQAKSYQCHAESLQLNLHAGDCFNLTQHPNKNENTNVSKDFADSRRNVTGIRGLDQKLL